jgi:hypothetical protein
MTPAEHRLVIWVLARQVQQAKTFIDILKSRNVLADGDAEAFAASVFLDEASNSALLREAKTEYLKIAKQMGVETGLEPKS